MDENIIARVFPQIKRCLAVLIGADGKMGCYDPIRPSFRVTETEHLGNGLTRYRFETLAEPLAVYEAGVEPPPPAPDEDILPPDASGPEPEAAPEEENPVDFSDPDMPWAPAPEEIAGSIVLDENYNLTRDEKGEIRFGPWKCLDPDRTR